MNIAVVLDGTPGEGTVRAHAAALAGFAGHGLEGGAPVATLVFYSDEQRREKLVELAPTRDVRLVKVPPHGADRMVESLAAAVRDGDLSLLLFAGGTRATELATRLSCRLGGDVLTDALSVEVAAQALTCRKSVYSNHLVARFELTARPACVTIDASWNDGADLRTEAHEILSHVDETVRATACPLEDVELEDAPVSGLAECRFLVVAGFGVGGREAVERIAAAAGRMGADFGASRPVVMSAWATTDRLIGVSGTRAAPALCIVAGASGAPAFHWGIEKAGFIVAINPDEHAPIVRNADAAVLDDGVAVVEELAEIVAPRRSG